MNLGFAPYLCGLNDGCWHRNRQTTEINRARKHKHDNKKLRAFKDRNLR
mgnify:CR=1 FL=1